MHNIRIFYRKQDRAKYISHLDINRCMQRALKRSGLPVWYTEGFHVHIYVTFALPTPLGFESDYEVMDFRLTEPVEMKEVISRLNESLPEGLSVFGAAEPIMKPQEIQFALYELSLSYQGLSAEEVKEKLDDFWNQEKILVTKKTKKAVKEIDLKPLVELLEIKKQDENQLFISMCTRAGIEVNINPLLFLEAFESRYGLSVWERNIRKKKIMDKNKRDFI